MTSVRELTTTTEIARQLGVGPTALNTTTASGSWNYRARNLERARAFRDFVLGDHGREVLVHYGFYKLLVQEHANSTGLCFIDAPRLREHDPGRSQTFQVSRF